MRYKHLETKNGNNSLFQADQNRAKSTSRHVACVHVHCTLQ